nr:LysM peptidoglycan-binding domain-containing protein [Maliibacterium massiliense]
MKHDQTTGAPLSGAEVYTVTAGENIVELGARLGIHWRDIAAFNRLAPPYTLVKGQRLRLPCDGGARTYCVRCGDTLRTIGARLDVVWRDIAALNHIAPPYTLYVGQQLRIPARTGKKS